jgi:hypothetical protein
MESFLTEFDVSEQLKVSVACLRRWRLRRTGPRFVKVGPLVRYRPEDLEDWVAALPAGGSPLTRHKNGSSGAKLAASA